MDVQVHHGDREIVGDGLAERSLDRPGQVGVSEDVSGLPDDATPELGRLTFDKVARTSHVGPRRLPALHDAHRDPHRGRE